VKADRAGTWPPPDLGRRQALGHAIVSATDQRHRLLHPIPQLVTWELKELRERLEGILSKPGIPSYTRPREQLQADLDAVIAEQDERERVNRESRAKARQADA
jgi:hypothetical protein